MQGGDGDEDEPVHEGEGEGDSYWGGAPYVPPASDSDSAAKPNFGENLEPHFVVPLRLRDKPYELIESANDWHYAMMNDHPRNEFYEAALRRHVTADSVVLEIGAGSGLLSIIAASLGARQVVAIEANRHLAAVAREIVRINGFEGRVHIINKMSTEVTPAELAPYGTPTVLLSEILGTLLLGESALHYVWDARQRLVAPDAAVVPLTGCQFATLIESPDIASITSVGRWKGVDLRWFNTLQDTTSMVFTKQYGFRFSSCNYRALAPKLPALRVNFARDHVGVWRGEMRQRFVATASGVVHAVLATWEVHADESAGLAMSTHPDDTLNNFPRDMQWGQGVQLIEDLASDGAAPVPFVVQAGEELTLVTRYSRDGVTLQFALERAAKAE
jgi:protein arginine N-methyltransferase 7